MSSNTLLLCIPLAACYITKADGYVRNCCSEHDHEHDMLKELSKQMVARRPHGLTQPGRNLTWSHLEESHEATACITNETASGKRDTYTN